MQSLIDLISLVSIDTSKDIDKIGKFCEELESILRIYQTITNGLNDLNNCYKEFHLENLGSNMEIDINVKNKAYECLNFLKNKTEVINYVLATYLASQSIEFEISSLNLLSDYVKNTSNDNIIVDISKYLVLLEVLRVKVDEIILDCQIIVSEKKEIVKNLDDISKSIGKESDLDRFLDSGFFYSTARDKLRNVILSETVTNRLFAKDYSNLKKLFQLIIN